VLDVHNRDGIVIENRGDIFRGKLVCRVADEKTSLADSTVTNDHAPKQSDGQRHGQLLK
jgi:hypothetical protein